MREKNEVKLKLMWGVTISSNYIMPRRNLAMTFLAVHCFPKQIHTSCPRITREPRLPKHSTSSSCSAAHCTWAHGWSNVGASLHAVHQQPTTRHAARCWEAKKSPWCWRCLGNMQPFSGPSLRPANMAVCTCIWLTWYLGNASSISKLCNSPFVTLFNFVQLKLVSFAQLLPVRISRRCKVSSLHTTEPTYWFISAWIPFWDVFMLVSLMTPQKPKYSKLCLIYTSLLTLQFHSSTVNRRMAEPFLLSVNWLPPHDAVFRLAMPHP